MVPSSSMELIRDVMICLTSSVDGKSDRLAARRNCDSVESYSKGVRCRPNFLRTLLHFVHRL